MSKQLSPWTVKWSSHFLLFCAVVGLALPALAAAEQRGQVKFGAVPVPGATVTAIQGDRKSAAITDENGVYSFPDLADGVWTIQVEMQCFSTLKKEIAVAPGAPGAPAAEWELKLLSMDEIKATGLTTTAAGSGTPPAAAAAPARPAASSAQSTKAPSRNGRNAKGAAAQAPNSQTGFQRAEVNASGEAAAAASEPAPLSATDEMSQSASDAFVVNGSTSNGIERRAFGNARKGLGSLFSGGFMFQFDNSFLNARNYSITGQDTPQQAYNHIVGGANVGGPLQVPHLFKTSGNFFVNYQTVRNRNAQNESGMMPTAAERAGNFTGLTDVQGKIATLLDPATGQAFPANQIPLSRIINDKPVQSLLQFYPLPNFPQSLRYNYQVPVVGTQAVDMVQARVNKNVNNKNFWAVAFNYQNSRQNNPNIFTFTDKNNTLGMNAGLNLRRTFNRRISGNFGVSYSRQSVRMVPYFTAQGVNVSELAGIAGNDQTPADYGPPSLTFNSGIQGLTDGTDSFTRNQTAAATAVINWSRRPHNFTFGADVRRQQFNLLSQQNGRGTFGFTGAGTGFDFADFLLGLPGTINIAYGNADKYIRSAQYDTYFVDDWRMNASLTLNLGVRWEYGSPAYEKYGRMVNLDITPGFAAAVPVAGSNPTGAFTHASYPDSLMRPDRHGVQPRVSFAWKPIFGASTVVRGGYGVYYDTSVYQPIVTNMLQQPPFSGPPFGKTLDIANNFADPLTLANAFTATPGVLTNTFGVDPNFRVGYSQNWQLSVQQNVTASTVLTATYLGIKGTRAMQAFLPNTYPQGAVNPCPSCTSGYVYLTSNGNSTRESGQLSLRRRFHSGVSANLQYTYSKAIDDAALGGRGNTNRVIAQNWLDLSAERGLSGFDQRHLLTLSLQYSTGVGVRGGGLLGGWRGLAVKGWTFVSNITAGTGFPLTPIYSAPVPGSAVQGPIRPLYTGAPVYVSANGSHLNPAAYLPPPAGQWGNAGRNSITGPGQFSMNASMQRTFADNFDLRFDSTNVLNHPSYTSYNTTINSGFFGVLNPPGNMRVVQATLRWRF